MAELIFCARCGAIQSDRYPRCLTCGAPITRLSAQGVRHHLRRSRPADRANDRLSLTTIRVGARRIAVAHHPRSFKPAGAIRRTAWLLVIAALLTTGPAAAQRALPSAEALYEVCSVALDIHGKMESGQIHEPPNLVAATRYGQCFGYITGAMEALAVFQTEAGQPYFCLPGDLRNLDVARQFHQAYRKAPEMADWSPRFAIFMTLAEYACAEVRPMTSFGQLRERAR